MIKYVLRQGIKTEMFIYSKDYLFKESNQANRIPLLFSVRTFSISVRPINLLLSISGESVIFIKYYNTDTFLMSNFENVFTNCIMHILRQFNIVIPQLNNAMYSTLYAYSVLSFHV